MPSQRVEVLSSGAGRFWQGYQRQDDSTAALGMVLSGLGRTRHVRVQYLLIQQKVQDKELVVEKADTK